MTALARARPAEAPGAAAAAVTAAILGALLAGAFADVAFLGGILRFREDPEVEAFGFVLLAGWSVAASLTVGALSAPGRAPTITTAAALSLRIVLGLAIVFMYLYTFLPQLEGKSMTMRSVAFPLLTSVIPLLYLWRGRDGAYPGAVDVAWTSAFTFDIVSNDLHWYGTWDPYDDFVHFLNAVPYMLVTASLVLALERLGVVRVGVWGAAVTAVLVNLAGHALWEMWEHYSDVLLGTNLQPGGMTEASTNMLWALAGSIPAIAVLWWWDRSGALRAVVDPLAALLGRAAGRREPATAR